MFVRLACEVASSSSQNPNQVCLQKLSSGRSGSRHRSLVEAYPLLLTALILKIRPRDFQRRSPPCWECLRLSFAGSKFEKRAIWFKAKPVAAFRLCDPHSFSIFLWPWDRVLVARPGVGRRVLAGHDFTLMPGASAPSFPGVGPCFVVDCRALQPSSGSHFGSFCRLLLCHARPKQSPWAACSCA